MRVLLIEDHQRLASLICRGLSDANIDVDSVGTAEAAFDALDSLSYDAMILDLGLPDQDGLEFLKTIRNSGMAVPVLILTSRIRVDDRVTGLNTGADDYLTKPFHMHELVARLHALFRRPSIMIGKIVTSGDISFNIMNREVRIRDKLIQLTPRETRVLEQLMMRSGKVVPKENLERGLYGIEDEISSNSLEVLIHRLRKKLIALDAEARVHTVRGVGYMILPNE